MEGFTKLWMLFRMFGRMLSKRNQNYTWWVSGKSSNGQMKHYQLKFK